MPAITSSMRVLIEQGTQSCCEEHCSNAHLKKKRAFKKLSSDLHLQESDTSPGVSHTRLDCLCFLTPSPLPGLVRTGWITPLKTCVGKSSIANCSISYPRVHTTNARSFHTILQHQRCTRLSFPSPLPFGKSPLGCFLRGHTGEAQCLTSSGTEKWCFIPKYNSETWQTQWQWHVMWNKNWIPTSPYPQNAKCVQPLSGLCFN